MNKETRQFIWGILLVIMCSYGFVYGTNKMNHGDFSTWNCLFTLSQLYCIVMGGYYIYKGIE